MHLSNGMAPSSTMASLPLKKGGTPSAAFKQESADVIAAEQEPGINPSEIIAVSQECERSKPMIIPAAQESLRIKPVIIEAQSEQVEGVTYEVFNHGGSRHGGARLIDSTGYTYYKQRTRWVCTLACNPVKWRRCKATVIQRGAMFLPGKHRHNHDPKVGKVTARRIEALVREEAHCNLLKPVSTVVNEVSKFASNYFFLGEQWWHSGESSRLPPMWPGVNSQTRHHVWVEFVGSLLCSEKFLPGYSGFTPLLKNLHLIRFDMC